MSNRIVRAARVTVPALLLASGVYCVGRRTLPNIESARDGRIVPATNMTIVRASQTATLLPDGKVLIAGGFAGSGTEYRPYRTTEIYDPAAGKFTPGPDMTVGRSGQTATTLKDGRILLVGGWTGMYQANGTAEIYDPATDTFKATGNMTIPRAGSTATLLENGKVLIAGGVNSNEEALSSAEVYDPASGKFSTTGSMVHPRGEHTATLLKDGEVLIVGGGSGHYPSQTVYRSTELYNPATGKFTIAADMFVPRHKHAAVLLKNGNVLIVGGSDNRDWRGEYSSAELYDPATKTFTATGSMAMKRFKLPAAAVLLKDGRVLVAGGGERAEIYDPQTGSFSTVPGSLGAARFFASATMLPNGKALIAGGYAESHNSLPSTSSAFIYEP